jgi:phosphoglycolate phosphatase
VRVEFLVFDLDGTLFDTRADIVSAVNRARSEYTLAPLPFEKIVKMVGDGMGTLGAKAFADSAVGAEVGAACVKKYYLLQPCEATVPYSGATELLEKIKLPKAILSNKPLELILPILDKWNCRNYFLEVLGGDSFVKRKPDPVGIFYLSEKYKISPNSMMMIGDHHPDIEVAKATGMNSVFCRFGFSGEKEMGADFSIDHFSELPAILSQLT